MHTHNSRQCLWFLVAVGNLRHLLEEVCDGVRVCWLSGDLSVEAGLELCLVTGEKRMRTFATTLIGPEVTASLAWTDGIAAPAISPSDGIFDLIKLTVDDKPVFGL